MSYPKKIMLLLVGTIIFSYIAKAESRIINVNEVVNLLQSQWENPLKVKAISLTVQLIADPLCPVGTLQAVIAPVVSLIEKAPISEVNFPAWFASLGSPFKELMTGVEDGKNIHGIIAAHVEVEKLQAALKIAVNHNDDCNEQVWAAVVQGCADFLTRCAPSISDGGTCCLGDCCIPLQEFFLAALKTPSVHLQISMEFKMQDDTIYSVLIHG